MNGRPWWVPTLHFAGLGWYIAVSIIAGTMGGAWLDGKAGTSPLFLLLGLLLGVVVAFYGTYRMAAEYFAGPKNSKGRGRRSS